ncbi:hypothetical protein EVU96_13100 [Bacillus infantis]|uniref:hypothetical protein n=1 Tax=Bacillus infantis TaxID=324767 RepID=UPI00101DACF8|nr:hypothetical protein [Bacillus infantis]RYI28858.1 hypothetical protein EVU96_13100 [Bacillus infantis]
MKKNPQRIFFKRTDAKEINLNFKPGFFDALQLLKPYPSAHYCQILLDQNTSHRNNSKINHTDVKLLQYNEEPDRRENLLRETGGINYSLLTSLLIKTSRNSVSFAIQVPDSRVKTKEKSPLPSLAEYKRQKRTL